MGYDTAGDLVILHYFTYNSLSFFKKKNSAEIIENVCWSCKKAAKKNIN